MNLASRYYSYLEGKCLESSKYDSLNEMRGQVLPWMCGAVGLILAAVLAFPNGGTASDLLFIAAMTLWFVGIGFVGVAFTRAAMKRRRLGDSPGGGEG